MLIVMLNKIMHAIAKPIFYFEERLSVEISASESVDVNSIVTSFICSR